MSTTTRPQQTISNPYQVIARIQWGWTAEQIRSVTRELAPDQATRWFHTIGGAEAAFQTMEQLKFARVAAEVSRWLESISCAKDCSNGNAG